MKKSRLIRGGLVAAATLILSAAPGAAAPTATISALSANLTTTSVGVVGKATFAGDVTTVGTDATGDAVQKGVGADVTEATIQLAANGRDLIFTLKLADQLPAPALMGPTVIYNWGLVVNEQDSGYFLHAGRAGLSGLSPSTDPILDLNQRGSGGFSHVASLTGKMADGVVQWTVPMAQIGAAPGSSITPSATVRPGSHLGVTGTYVYYNNTAGDAITVAEFIVPGTVSLGIAPSTTPVDSIPMTAAAVTKANGSFTGSLPTPTTAGIYTVVAKACADDATCTVATTTITK